MEYRTLEARLAKLHQISDDGLGAFRARLRVLREMGIPPIPKVGKGARANFRDSDFGEVHLALTMSEFGLPPARIVQLMSYIRKTRGWPPRPASDQWLAVTLRAPAENLTKIDDERGLLSVRIVNGKHLSEALQDRELNTLTTWHAVLSLNRFAIDILAWGDD
jgi:hypothetical protein